MISGVNRGAVYITSDARAETLAQVTCWPADAECTATMRSLAIKALHNGAGLIKSLLDKDDGRREVLDHVAYPITRSGQRLAVVVLAMEMRSEEQRRAVLQLLQWGAIWLERALQRQTSNRNDAAALALQSVALLAQTLPFPVVAHQFCSLLADRLGCARVAVGLPSGLQLQLLAVSHQLRFDRRMALLSRIEAAMEESVDQARAVSLPMVIGDEPSLNRAHLRLLEEPGVGAVCTLPLVSNEQTVGALTLLWDKAERLDRPTAKLASRIVADVAPVLALKQRDARPWWRRAREGGVEFTHRLLGAGYLRFKMIAVSLLLGVALAGLLQTDHRVTAPAATEGTLQQAVVAPLASYLLAAHARAGDSVKKDQLLAVLDNRELLLERERQLSERDKHAKEYQEALAARDRAKISITRARVAQAEARLRLVEEQLRRTELRAPFAGTLVSGDLSRTVGAPVERGQLLFEIVPSDAYRISLQVDEHDVANLQTGQRGSLRLAGMPHATIPFRLSRILPIAASERGGNHFRVEAELETAVPELRPGMQGVAKVVIGQGSYLWVWTHGLFDRLRLWAWSVGF